MPIYLSDYWLIGLSGTIRFQLKQLGESPYWTKIVRGMSTQKLVTTQSVNALDETVELKQCSRPRKDAVRIFSALNLKQAPFKKIKICRSQPPPG
ncbi:MAG: transposase [Dysgonamonadaceae bacterium]